MCRIFINEITLVLVKVLTSSRRATVNVSLHHKRHCSFRSVVLGPDQVLLRGAVLRNTRWVFGVVIYTGHDTKLMQNNTATAPLKRSSLDRLINTQTLMLFFILLLLCVLSAIFNVVWTNANKEGLWYLGLQGNYAGSGCISRIFT